MEGRTSKLVIRSSFYEPNYYLWAAIVAVPASEGSTNRMSRSDDLCSSLRRVARGGKLVLGDLFRLSVRVTAGVKIGCAAALRAAAVPPRAAEDAEAEAEGGPEAREEGACELGHAQVHIRSTVPRSSCRICNCSLELVAVIEITVTPRERYQMRNVLFVISGETKKHISDYVHVQSACLTCACERFLSTARSVQRFGL